MGIAGRSCHGLDQLRPASYGYLADGCLRPSPHPVLRRPLACLRQANRKPGDYGRLPGWPTNGRRDSNPRDQLGRLIQSWNATDKKGESCPWLGKQPRTTRLSHLKHLPKIFTVNGWPVSFQTGHPPCMGSRFIQGAIEGTRRGSIQRRLDEGESVLTSPCSVTRFAGKHRWTCIGD
jgi:hypothetical protein